MFNIVSDVQRHNGSELSYVQNKSLVNNVNLTEQGHRHCQSVTEGYESCQFTQWDQNISIGDIKPYQFKNIVTCIDSEQEQLVACEPHTTVENMSVGSQANGTNAEILHYNMGSLHRNNIKEELPLYIHNLENETTCMRQDIDTTESRTAVEEAFPDPNTMYTITANEELLNLHCHLNKNTEDIGLTAEGPSSDNILKPSICQSCGDACANEEILRLHICTNTATATCITTNFNIASNRNGSISRKQRQNESDTRRCYVKLYDCMSMISSQCSTSHTHNDQVTICLESDNAVGRNDAQNYTESTNGNINESIGTNILQADHDQNTDTAVASSYKCEECHAIFKRKSRLKQHLQIHLQPFKCQNCGDSFSSELYLHDHYCIHTSEPYECDNCGAHFADLEHLQRHSRTHEAENYSSDENYSSEDEDEIAEDSTKHRAKTFQTNKPYCCKLCSASCTTKYNLNQHLIVHSRSKLYKCTECDWPFSRSDKLRNHILIYHRSNSSKNPEHNFVCTKTKDTCTSVINTEIELQTNHDAIIAFTETNAIELAGNGDLVAAQRSLGNKGTLTTENCCPAYELNSAEQPCSVQPLVSKSVDLNSSDYVNPNSSICPTVRSSTHPMCSTGKAIETPELCSIVNTPQQTIVSDLTRRSTTRFTYKCDKCEKVLEYKHNLARHVENVHSDVRPYKCEECGRFYSTITALKSHSRYHLDNSVLCKICGKRCSTAQNLKMHIRSHTGEKPFKCSQCPAAFSQSARFKVHLRIHSGEKPYKCTKCEASFTSQKGLSNHIATHSNKRPYLCEICGAAFRIADLLRIHRRIHTGVKAYKCAICGSAFTVSCTLKRHMLIHSGERPYKCAECGNTFTQKEHLKKHIRTMH